MRVPITAWPPGSVLPLRVTGFVTSCGPATAPDGAGLRFVVRFPEVLPAGAGPAGAGTTGAAELVTAGDVMQRLSEVRDRVADVTLAGGEPLAQPGFTSAVLHLVHELGLHTTLETGGRPRGPVSDQMLRECDLVVLDLPARAADALRAQSAEQSGPVAEPLCLLARLNGLGRPVRIRVPEPADVPTAP